MLFLCGNSHSQEASGSPLTLDSISLAGAPALALSDSAPTDIARPTGAKELGISLLGGSDGGNFAFETKPYWWSSHSIGEDFYKAGTGVDVILQTLSLSGARYEVENAKGDDVAEVSIGLAFDILRGPATKKFNTLRDKHAELGRVSGNIPQGLTDEEELAWYKMQRESSAAERRELANDMITEMVKGRVGWNASFATATSFQFEDKDYTGGEFAKTGAWFVTSYTPDTGGNQISYMGLVRFLDDRSPGVNDTYFDAGARLLITFDERPFSISAEYIRRHADNSSDSDRVSALLEYQVDEKLSVFASHGITFDQASGKDEIFSALGLSFGIGK